MESLYGTVAGLDVQKKTVVAVLLQSAQPDQDFASGIFGTTHFGLKEPVAFLVISELKPAADLGRRCGCRPVPYLNNILEQDHRSIKLRVRVSQGFRSFDIGFILMRRTESDRERRVWIAGLRVC
jgi:hypothetical protein